MQRKNFLARESNSDPMTNNVVSERDADSRFYAVHRNICLNYIYISKYYMVLTQIQRVPAEMKA